MRSKDETNHYPSFGSGPMFWKNVDQRLKLRPVRQYATITNIHEFIGPFRFAGDQKIEVKYERYWGGAPFFLAKRIRKTVFFTQYDVRKYLENICRQTVKKRYIFSTYFWPQKGQGLTSILWSEPLVLFLTNSIRRTVIFYTIWLEAFVDKLQRNGVSFRHSFGHKRRRDSLQYYYGVNPCPFFDQKHTKNNHFLHNTILRNISKTLLLLSWPKT